MKQKLTTKQSVVLDVLRRFIKKKKCSPSLSELKQSLQQADLPLKSNNSLVQYLTALEEKGYIQRLAKFKGIRLLEETTNGFVSIPLVGAANCGEALNFADDTVEDYISISSSYLQGDQGNFFFLKAIGDSMNEEGINNGDYVLVKKKQEMPKVGDIVVAVINGLGTIKKFFKKDDTVALMPSSNNPKHQPIVLHPEDDTNICGEVVRVFDFGVSKK